MEIIWEGVTTKYKQTVFRVCRSSRFDDDEYDLSFFVKEFDAFGTMYWKELYPHNDADGADGNYIKYLKYYLVSVVLPIARETV